jgi:hypothetical protein
MRSKLLGTLDYLVSTIMLTKAQIHLRKLTGDRETPGILEY